LAIFDRGHRTDPGPGLSMTDAAGLIMARRENQPNRGELFNAARDSSQSGQCGCAESAL